MRRFVFFVLAIALVAAAGCGNGKQEQSSEDYQQEARKVSGGSLIDPVDDKPVDVSTSQYSYIYDNKEYNFNSKENMEAFMKDPEKYIDKK